MIRPRVRQVEATYDVYYCDLCKSEIGEATNHVFAISSQLEIRPPLSMRLAELSGDERGVEREVYGNERASVEVLRFIVCSPCTRSLLRQLSYGQKAEAT